MERKDNSGLVRSLIEAFNQRELDRAAELMGPDVKCVNIATGQVYRGPLGYLELVNGWLAAFPDAQLEIHHLIGSGELVAVELTGRGTHTGSLALPGGPIAATGRHLSLQFCQVHQLRAGRVTNLRVYLDTATMLQQLGVRV